MKIELTHSGGMAFRGLAGTHEIVLDTSQLGGQDTGPTPKQMLIASVIGCTGMDVVGLFKKFRQNVTELKISGAGELTEEHPKVFREILVTYNISGPELDAGKIKEAVDLSLTKYCGVSAMVNLVSPVKYKIVINGQETASGEAHF